MIRENGATYTPGHCTYAEPASNRISPARSNQVKQPARDAIAAGRTVYLFLCEGKAGYLTPADASRVGRELLRAVYGPDRAAAEEELIRLESERIKVKLDEIVTQARSVAANCPATV